MIAAYSAISRNMPSNGLQVVMFTRQDASVWADMAAIVWDAGLQVTAAWYIATETTSELKKGGYVQRTVLLILRKRTEGQSVYRDEIVQEACDEVARQIHTMTGLNQSTKGAGRSENLFEDTDLQMAGYDAAFRVLTGYSRIDGQDMAAEALRPRQKGTRDVVKEIIDFAVQVANEHLVPEGIPAALWEGLTGPERFYLKMLDIEAAGLKKIDDYQNFAKAFRYGDYNGYGVNETERRPPQERARKGEELKPWQRAFVGLFLEHPETYGSARFILADEVGVGKTLSLATSAMVGWLLSDGPALILAPATLCQQWQVELKDKLGLPSAVWMSSTKVWQDANGHIIKTRGAEDIRLCPFQIGIVSTGLIVQHTPKSRALLECRFGTLVLDEAHRARRSRGITGHGDANRLLTFMLHAALRARHIILGTATPVQTNVEELWDLLEILNTGAEHVLGHFGSYWRRPETALPVLTGQRGITDEHEAWQWLRNPLPAKNEHHLFTSSAAI